MLQRNEAAIEPGVIWITGYSGAGKTTVARKVEHILRQGGAPVVLLDGDDLRSIFAARWGYERNDRVELGKVYFRLANHLASQGLVVIVSAVALYAEVSSWLRTNVSRHIEIFLNVPREVLLERDARTKRIYSKVPGLADIYDPPDDHYIVIDNFGSATPDGVASLIVDHYRQNREPSADKGKASFWEGYYGKTVGVLEPSPFAIHASGLLPAGFKVLEVGCGNGRDATYLSKRLDVTAIDTSQAAVTLCRELHAKTNVRFNAGPLSSFASQWENQFDAVYSRFVLHAMTDVEEQEMLRDAYRVLKPGGMLLIECRSINDPLAREGEVISLTERIAGHYRRFIVLQDLRDRSSATGFVEEDAVEASGLAKFGDEDPVVIRFIARKPGVRG